MPKDQGGSQPRVILKARRRPSADLGSSTAAQQTATGEPVRYGLRSRQVPATEETHRSRPGNLKSIFTTETTEGSGMDMLTDAADHLERGIGLGYSGPVDVVGDFTLPHRDRVENRKRYRQADLMEEVTGERSATKFMRAQGYEGDYHIGHYKDMGSHGKDAHRPDNIGPIRVATNGAMIPIDDNTPSGMLNASYAEHEAGTAIPHVVHQVWTHPDAPELVLFHQQHDAHMGALYGGQWDAMAARAKQSAEHFQGLHLLSNLNPDAWQTVQGLQQQRAAESAQLADLNEQYRRHAPSQYNDDTVMSDRDD